MKKIAYYITAHGYGHGARSCDILNALRTAASEVPIIVTTDLPTAFFKNRLLPDIDIRSGAFDIGLIQKDSIRADVTASLQSITSLYDREEELIEQERHFIRSENVGLVVADIPAIPLAAAQCEKLPNIGCSNFGWNWIYSEFAETDPRWQVYVDKFSEVYNRTDLLLRQPFSESMDSFPNIIDLPLLAKPGSNRRDEISEATGADPDKHWVLLSFTSLNLDFQALENLKSVMNDYELFTVEPLIWSASGIHALARSLAAFSDIMASVDLVVTKPGFGIVSECIANDKPIIYSNRKNFLEYPVLVEAIERYCRHAFIPNTDLYSGNLAQALSHARKSPPPSAKIARGGADKAAKIILSYLD